MDTDRRFVPQLILQTLPGPIPLFPDPQITRPLTNLVKRPELFFLPVLQPEDGDAFKQARTAVASSQVARGKVVERVLKYIQAKEPLS